WELDLRAVWRRLYRDTDGSAMVSFAFVMPVLITLSLGILEFTLIIFDYQRAAEATRVGARIVAISNPVADVSEFTTGSSVTCSSSGGSISCGGEDAASEGVFDTLIAEMSALHSGIQADNVEIQYEDSGLGDPTTPGGIMPLITLRLVGMEHQFLMLSSVPGMPDHITYPPFTTNQLAGGMGPTGS
ncbi:MAG: pilus assembly protein, partial [Alphaproteobacteria bacterium]|nr:pilus assembly protein [Alphaproteobacteria bacterium]